MSEALDRIRAAHHRWRSERAAIGFAWFPSPADQDRALRKADADFIKAVEPATRREGSAMSITDPCERIIAAALEAAGVPYIHESADKGQRLDFRLPTLDAWIEVKQFWTARTSGQIEGLENVIVVQGMAAARVFARLISPARQAQSVTVSVTEPKTAAEYGFYESGKTRGTTIG